MLFVSFLILLVAIKHKDGQLNLYSDIDLFTSGTEFIPINSIELLSSDFARTLADCGSLCNGNVQCRTFDYDSTSLICRQFEGVIETGQVVPSGSPTSRIGSVRLRSSLFAAFGQPCPQCETTRYLVCSSNSNNTCQCPKNTFWNGRLCQNQGYDDTNCSNNQWCRNDVGIKCSKLNFCTEHQCGNMTIIKSDLYGNDLAWSDTSNFSLCCSTCQNYAGCKAFSWVSSPGSYFGKCFLKSSEDGGGIPFDGHISAYY